MESYANEIEALLSDQAAANKMDDKTAELYFDDEPLENVLYQKDAGSASCANLFLPSRRHIKNLEKACIGRNLPEIISAISELETNRIEISVETYKRIADLMAYVFPYYPNPIMSEDLSIFRPFFERIWELAIAKKEEALKIKGGPLLFRWYEHHGEYENAKKVLDHLVELYRKKGDRYWEGVMVNNFAFENLLEERWSEAIPIFDQAATIFKLANISFDYENSIANYWTCRFALNDFGNINETRTEIEKLAIFFKGKGLWHERKPLIILARIEEMEGNFNKAIELVESAIESAKNSNTRYPEIDGKYLVQLKKRKAGG